MNFAQALLLGLKILAGLLQWLRDKEKINEGYDKAIAEVSLQIFNKTAFAKQVKDKVNDMSGADIDILLRELTITSPK